jgi:hypothetical protein
MLPIFFYFTVFFFSQSSALEPKKAIDSNLTKYIDQALDQKVYKEKAWSNLLFFSQSFLPGAKSLVDDPAFFFSKQGKFDPQKELVASLKAFFSNDKMTVGKAVRHPRCFFAARWYWLKSRLNIDESELPIANCRVKDVYDENLDYSKVSMVFSSFYVNSPASMFGHTLLRFHRETNGLEVLDDGLLDDAANYAAFVDTKNPLAYAYNGMLGGFQGRFALLPYYKKIFDYSYSERRDIWEYELNFNKKEVNFLKLLIFEMSFFYIDYYYADDNCSFILLKALEAVRPSLKLSTAFPAFTVPSDTVKTLYNHKPKVVEKINFRSSSHTKYMQRAKSLSDREKAVASNIVQKKEVFFNKDCTEECRSRSIDAALDFIDYKTSIKNLDEKNKYSNLRSDLLLKRSELDAEPVQINHRPTKSVPHKGHRSAMFSFSWLNSGEPQTDGLGYFRFRPALHDFDANGSGYSNLLKTGFGDVTLEYDFENDNLDIFETHFIEIFTLRVQEPFESPWSWHLDVGMNKDVFNDQGDIRKRYYFEMGFGKTYAVLKKSLYVYGLTHFQVGYSPLDELRSYGGVNVHAGLILPMGQFAKLTAYGRYEWLYGKNDIGFFKASARLNIYPAEQHELFIEASKRWDEDFYGAGYRFYL